MEHFGLRVSHAKAKVSTVTPPMVLHHWCENVPQRYAHARTTLGERSCTDSRAGLAVLGVKVVYAWLERSGSWDTLVPSGAVMMCLARIRVRKECAKSSQTFATLGGRSAHTKPRVRRNMPNETPQTFIKKFLSSLFSIVRS